MSAAQRDTHPLDETASETEAAPFALKEQVVERLAAHRARRTQHSPKAVTPIAEAAPAKDRTAKIAAAVAERYAQSQSYRSYLAAEAERAIRQAEAAAEVAALNAQAVANAQYELLAELDQWALTPPPSPSEDLLEADELTESSTPSQLAAVPAVAPQFAAAPAIPEPLPPPALPELTVKLYEEVARTPTDVIAAPHRFDDLDEPLDEAEGLALDEEIAFRHAPVFEEPAGPPIDIPANLIEFPRQLVAPRKARPRLAEGPLREDADASPSTTQLRIFEVEAAQISTAPVVESVEPEWSSIMLGAAPAAIPVEPTQPVFNPALPPQAAALSVRIMAVIVDACIVVAALLAFMAACAITLDELPARLTRTQVAAPMSMQTAAITGVAVLGVFAVLYYLLFFTFSEATPGMRYARIGLCTFSDDNPTRAAMRRRLLAIVLATCPLGIGFFWALLDDDKLGWHDRISRMYQRSY